MRELTVGTLVGEGGSNCPPGWVKVTCQFCGEEMYCQESNSKPKPGCELVLSCHKCLINLESNSMDEVKVDGGPIDPWSDAFKWN